MSIPIEQSKSILGDINSLSSSVTSGMSSTLEGSFDAMLNVIGEENSIQKSSNDDNKWASEYSQRVDSDEQNLSRESQKRRDQHDQLTSRDQDASKVLEQRQQRARQSKEFQEEISAQKKMEQERYLAKKESSRLSTERLQDRQAELAQEGSEATSKARRDENSRTQDTYSDRVTEQEDLELRENASQSVGKEGFGENFIEELQDKALEQSFLDSAKTSILDNREEQFSYDDNLSLHTEDASEQLMEVTPVVSEELNVVLNDLLHQETEDLEFQVLSQDDLIVANSAEELLQHLIEKSNLFDMQLQEELAEKLSGQIAAIQSLALQDLGERSTYVAASSSDAASIVKQEMHALTQPLGQLMGALGGNEEFIASIDSEQLKLNQENELSSAQKNQQGRMSQRGLMQGQMGAQSLVQAAGIKADILGFNAVEAGTQAATGAKDVASAAIQSLDTSAHSGALADQSGLLGDASNKELLIAQNESKLQGLKGQSEQSLTKVSRQVFSRMVDIIERLIEQYKPPFDPAALRQLDIRVNDPAGQIVMEIIQENNQIFVKATAPEGALSDLVQVRADIENSLNNQGMELGSWDLQKAEDNDDNSSDSGKKSKVGQDATDKASGRSEKDILRSLQEESHLINREL